MAVATVDTSKICKITNNTGIDFTVVLPLSDIDSVSANSIVSVNRDLEIIPVGKGGTKIAAGDTDTVTLDRTYKKNGVDTYAPGYDLLISTTNWLSPISNIGVLQDYDDDGKDFFDPLTVAATEKTAMQQALAFYQTIAAYPTSQLAKDYISAMTGTESDANNAADGGPDSGSNTSAAISKGVSAFFKATKSYKLVTLANIVALENYYNSFVFVWAQYTDAVTYYLYSCDGKTTTFAGALALKKSGAIDITKVNSGYSCSFSPAVTPTDTSKTDVDTTKARSLTYVNGVFVDDLQSDVPAIALKGTFQLKRTFTKTPTDTSIIAVISGSIDGISSIGFNSTQATKPDNTTQDWLNSLFHPKTAAEIFNSVMQILGALMMLHFIGTTLFGMGKWIKKQISAKEPVNKEDLDTQKESLESEFKAKAESSYKKVSSADKDAKLPESSEDALNQAATEKANLGDQVSAGQAQENLSKMKQSVKDQLENAPPEDGDLHANIETAAGDVRDATVGLNEADAASLRAELAELRPKLAELNSRVTKLNEAVEKLVSEDQKAGMQENQKSLEEAQNAIEDETKTAQDEVNDGTSEDPNAEVEGFDFG